LKNPTFQSIISRDKGDFVRRLQTFSGLAEVRFRNDFEISRGALKKDKKWANLTNNPKEIEKNFGTNPCKVSQIRAKIPEIRMAQSVNDFRHIFPFNSLNKIA